MQGILTEKDVVLMREGLRRECE